MVLFYLHWGPHLPKSRIELGFSLLLFFGRQEDVGWLRGAAGSNCRGIQFGGAGWQRHSVAWRRRETQLRVAPDPSDAVKNAWEALVGHSFDDLQAELRDWD